MRFIIVVILFSISLSTYSQGSKEVENSLNDIRNGYVLYGINGLSRSAAQNDIFAQFYLARCYENGFGVEKDNEKAFKLYRRSAERGLPDAMYYLALCYKNSIGVAPNDARYKEWLNRFINRGGKLELPDIVELYQAGITKNENFALNPNSDSVLHDYSKNKKSHPNSNVSVIHHINNHNNIEEIKKESEENTTALSYVDQNIPTTIKRNDNKFAFIIANENYQIVPAVPFATHDGEIFAEYCNKTLGIPSSNIHLIKNATLNNIRHEISVLKQTAHAYKGDASFIVYYAGHGIPDEKSRESYLIPIDGYPSDTATCYKLQDLYDTLSSLPATQIVLLFDACFSGSQRNSEMLTQARGVVLKPKSNHLTGNLILLSASTNDETAYSLDSENHGIFTYYLLKKLKESNGEVSLLELGEYIRENVLKYSLVHKGKAQTPTIKSSNKFPDLNNMKL